MQIDVNSVFSNLEAIKLAVVPGAACRIQRPPSVNKRIWKETKSEIKLSQFLCYITFASALLMKINHYSLMRLCTSNQTWVELFDNNNWVVPASLGLYALHAAIVSAKHLQSLRDT